MKSITIGAAMSIQLFSVIIGILLGMYVVPRIKTALGR